jgi:hypothetical protein
MTCDMPGYALSIKNNGGNAIKGEGNKFRGTGIFGMANGYQGKGVYGENPKKNGITYGVYGKAKSPNGYGVYGENTVGGYAGFFKGTLGANLLQVVDNTASDDTSAIYGEHAVTDGFGVGVSGKSLWTGVEGIVNATGDTSYYGVYGEATTTDPGGSSYGVYGYSAGSSNNYAVYGLSANGYAGYFDGDVHITGILSKGSGTFVQPHANDPTKEIQYAFFEGPEHAVFFRGTASLKNGTAVIELPENFRMVAAEEGIQVQVTPLEDCNGIFVASKSREQIEVKELMNGKHNAKFDYFITAVRAGFEDFQPVVANTHFKPKNNESAKEFENRFSKDDITTKALQAMLVSNGILTKDGKLNMAKVQELGWTIAEKKPFSKRNQRAKLIQ